MGMEIRTNVIYLTTLCNLNCSYCYERKNRETKGFVHKTITSAEINAFVDEVSTREEGYGSCVVIFGGEPLLKPDLIVELFDKFLERKKVVHFDLITNGTLIDPGFARMMKDYQFRLSKASCSLQIEVSYDVSGQRERLYPNGKESNSVVLRGIRTLQEFQIPFVISYVVSPSNVDNILKDVLYCILVLKASKVGLKWAISDLDLAGVDSAAVKEYIRPRLKEIYRRFKISICEEVCGDCKSCDKTKDGNSYCIPDIGIIKSESYLEKEFDHFREKP
jgi:sulfatase maturation enzyme AslB (radical SAM superfamily)